MTSKKIAATALMIVIVHRLLTNSKYKSLRKQFIDALNGNKELTKSEQLNHRELINQLNKQIMSK
ncbi:MAG: hypothetical protein LBL60_01200 [Mycoplasmataceae bacterium]|jgi:hypothetical protein|nr:hypothetical protein [Mycoplasmataceae bacterium]